MKLSKRYRIIRTCCSCLFPKEVFHRIEQRAIGFQSHVQGLEDGETLIHHYNPNDFRAKYTEGAAIVDGEGNKIEYHDNKNPTEEELQLYHLRAVSDLNSSNRYTSQRMSSTVESSGTSEGTTQRRR